MGLDSDESVEDQVTASSEDGDVVVSVDAEAVAEGASESVSEEVPAEAPSTDASGRPESLVVDDDAAPESVEALEALALDSDGGAAGEPGPPPDAAEPTGGTPESVESDHVYECRTHGGEMTRTRGRRFKWLCDAAPEPGSCRPVS